MVKPGVVPQGRPTLHEGISPGERTSGEVVVEANVVVVATTPAEVVVGEEVVDDEVGTAARGVAGAGASSR